MIRMTYIFQSSLGKKTNSKIWKFHFLIIFPSSWAQWQISQEDTILSIIAKCSKLQNPS